MLVIGILVVFAIGAYWLATDIAEHDPGPTTAAVWCRKTD